MRHLDEEVVENLPVEVPIPVTRALVAKAITPFGLGGSEVVLNGIMRILSEGADE